MADSSTSSPLSLSERVAADLVNSSYSDSPDRQRSDSDPGVNTEGHDELSALQNKWNKDTRLRSIADDVREHRRANLVSSEPGSDQSPEDIEEQSRLKLERMKISLEKQRQMNEAVRDVNRPEDVSAFNGISTASHRTMGSLVSVFSQDRPESVGDGLEEVKRRNAEKQRAAYEKFREDQKKLKEVEKERQAKRERVLQEKLEEEARKKEALQKQREAAEKAYQLKVEQRRLETQRAIEKKRLELEAQEAERAREREIEEKLSEALETSLFQIIGDDNFELVDLLLEHDPEILRSIDEQYGATALHFAAGWGSSEMLKKIIDAGVDLHFKSENDFCPLHTAASRGRHVAVKMLIEAGTVVDVRGRGGYTALHIAAERSHLETARILLEGKASVNVKGEDGMTPIDLAAGKGNQEIVELLACVSQPRRKASRRRSRSSLAVSLNQDSSDPVDDDPQTDPQTESPLADSPPTRIDDLTSESPTDISDSDEGTMTEAPTQSSSDDDQSQSSSQSSSSSSFYHPLFVATEPSPPPSRRSPPHPSPDASSSSSTTNQTSPAGNPPPLRRKNSFRKITDKILSPRASLMDSFRSKNIARGSGLTTPMVRTGTRSTVAAEPIAGADSTPPDETKEETEFIRRLFFAHARRGVDFRKHGRRGAPHNRTIKINLERETITWKRGKELNLSEIIKVVPGKHSRVLKRSTAATAMALHCFTVYTTDPTRCLDLEASSVVVRNEWVRWLSFYSKQKNS